jgi:DNA-binding CsgD family transcriptional regulator
MGGATAALGDAGQGSDLIDTERIEKLSNRERQILALAASGYLDKQIAVQLGVTGNTLSTYWRRIRLKLGNAHRVTLAVAYVEHASSQEPISTKLRVGYWRLDLVSGDYQADEELCSIFEVEPNTPELREALLTRFDPEERESCRKVVSEAVSAHRTRVRNTRRLHYGDGRTRWATLDLRIAYDGSAPKEALGTVMAFG